MTDQELIVAAAEKVCGSEVVPVKQFLRMRGIPHADTVIELEGVLYRRDARDHFVLAWNPLESIADAWMLIDTLRARGMEQRIVCQLDTMADAAGYPAERGGGIEWFIRGCKDAPRAITLAALAAVGVEL